MELVCEKICRWPIVAKSQETLDEICSACQIPKTLTDLVTRKPKVKEGE